MDTQKLQGLIDWLMDGARSTPSPPAFLKETCERLIDCGIPLWRAAAFVTTLHPDTYGRAFIWRRGGEVVVQAADFDILDTPEFMNSPVVIVQKTARELHYRMDDPESRRFPFFDDMRNEGVTDYLALPLLYTDGTVHVASWTTKEPGGFTDEQLAALRKVVLPFSRVGEIMAMRRTATTLLDTYVGNRAGERIWAGQIRRGHAEEMQAAIWLSDLRGFTALSDRLPAATVVEILNQYFDCQVPVIRKHGGEILKFMGDGLLAVFPIASDGRQSRRGLRRLPGSGQGGARQCRCHALSEQRRRRAFPFRRRAAYRRHPVRQYRRHEPAGLHLHRARGQSCGKAGEDRLETASHGGGVRGVRRRLPQRLDRSRRISDRGFFAGAAGVRPARRSLT